MKNLEEWAEYYYKMGIYIYPSYLDFDWKDTSAWSSFSQSIEDVRNYQWKLCDSFSGLSGQQGIRVLRLNISKESPLYRSYCIDKIFTLLNLERYPWVIDTQDALEIIINCHSFFDMKVFNDFKDFLLIFKGYFTLPFTGSKDTFYFNGVPTIKPAIVTQDSLASAIEVLKKDNHFIKREY